jgi:hypothetical protein
MRERNDAMPILLEQTCTLVACCWRGSATVAARSWNEAGRFMAAGFTACRKNFAAV